MTSSISITSQLLKLDWIIHDDISLTQFVIPGLTRNPVPFWMGRGDFSLPARSVSAEAGRPELLMIVFINITNPNALYAFAAFWVNPPTGTAEG
jgi:hypothetical protein